MLNRSSNHIDCLGMVKKKKKKANMVDMITVLNISDLFHRNISRGGGVFYDYRIKWTKINTKEIL